MNTPGYYELYQSGTLGITLRETLDTLVQDNKIQPQLAMRVLANYDRVMLELLKQGAKLKMTFKGHLKTYRFCDDVWNFILKDVTIKLDNNETVHVDRFKIVACNARKAGE